MLTHLADVSLRAAALALLAAVIVWLLQRRRTAALEHAIWTVVMCGMLALFAFGRVLPRLPLRILAGPAATVQVDTGPFEAVSPFDAAPRSVQGFSQASAKMHAAFDWKVIATYFYAAVVFALLARFATGIFLIGKLVGAAVPTDGGWYESEAITIPLTVGWLNPKVLLPRESREWSREKREAVMVHESAHVRRRDGLIAALAGLNRCVFWFHPISWLLERRLALLAERACDEACVATLGNREQYARLLIEMASVMDRSGRRLRYHALAMAATSHIRQRIDSLLEEGRTFSRGLSGAGWATLLLCSIPMVLAAATLKLDRQPALLSLPFSIVNPPVPVLLAQATPVVRPVQQPTAAAPLEFETASVRISAPDVDRTDIRVSPGSMIYHGMTLRLLIRIAWHIQDLQIVEGPSWLDSARFDITAKLDRPHPPLEMLAMLRNLLEDRFRLVVVPERRVQTHYSLVAATLKNGKHPGLTKANEDECPAEDVKFTKPSKSDSAKVCGGVRTIATENSAELVATSVPMSQFALILTGLMSKWVEDETGLDGYYDVRLDWPLSIGANPSSEGVAPDTTFLTGVLQNQLGLKLEPVKGPIPVFVIQRAEMPSEN